MTEPAIRFRVAVHNREVIIILCAVVVSQFEDSVPISPVLAGVQCLGAIVCEKIERESGILKIESVDLGETKETVEFD